MSLLSFLSSLSSLRSLAALSLCAALAVGCSGTSAPTGTPVGGGSGGSAGSGAAVPSAPPQVGGAEAKQIVAAGGLLLDVRTEEEFADGHIEGARNIPVHQLRAALGTLPRDKPIVVYCAVGSRSAVAAATLHAAGFQVKNLGGMSNWNR